jgi:hypothetical protein
MCAGNAASMPRNVKCCQLVRARSGAHDPWDAVEDEGCFSALVAFEEICEGRSEGRLLGVNLCHRFARG